MIDALLTGRLAADPKPGTSVSRQVRAVRTGARVRARSDQGEACWPFRTGARLRARPGTAEFCDRYAWRRVYARSGDRGQRIFRAANACVCAQGSPISTGIAGVCRRWRAPLRARRMA